MKHLFRVITHWALLLHIYISMAGFALTLLFAVTGLTLNHQDFGLGNPDVSNSTVAVPAELIERPDSGGIGNFFREKFSIRGPVTDYHEDPDQIQITFAAPGHRTIATINRQDRMAAVEYETRGILGKIDDLHKGFDSGRVWFYIIDFSAVLLTISAITGMVTLLALRHRRRTGFIVGGLSLASLVIVYLLFVPK